MPRKIDWARQVGRRFKLRDLHVFFTVAQRGSMAKAALELGVSQPAVSEVIADLERAVGARLLDRHPQGIEPTIYGRALLKRSIAVFDELKHGIQDIENLADPTSGELRIGCSESVAAFLSPLVQRFCGQYPRVVVNIDHILPPWAKQVTELRERKFDFILARLMVAPTLVDEIEDDVSVDRLFDDRLVVAAGMRSRWARQRDVELAELIDEPWILPGSAWNDIGMREAFRAKGLELPRVSLATYSVPLRIDAIKTGKFVTAMPRSIADRYRLKVLPINLPVRPWFVVILTLKNRTLSTLVERFIGEVRDFTRPMRAGGPANERSHKPVAVLRHS
jgi:DNA-binding transcriptional LysR family regulator